MKRYIAMASVLLVTGVAMYGCRPKSEEDMAKHAEKRAEWIAEKVTDELDLTPEQQKILQQVKTNLLSKRGEMKELHRGVIGDLFVLTGKETLTETEVNGMFEQREAKLKELRSFAVSQYVTFHNSLTPEQRTMLKEKAERYGKNRW
jgi:protein CpxP